MGKRGRMIGYANFVCPRCGHGVPATWRKRTKMYEGKCNHCGFWQKFLRPNGPAVQTLEWGDGPITRGPAEHAPWRDRWTPSPLC